MTRLRSVWEELVERRLWPVAAMLVVALIAVPLVIASGSDDKPSAPSARETASAPVAGQPAAVVSVDSVATVKRDRPGKARDPFVQQHVKKATTSTDASSGGGAGPLTPEEAAAQLNTAGVVPSTSGSGSTSGSSVGTAHTPAPSNYVYRVSVRVREAGKAKWYVPVARGDRLPTKADSALMFLGVMADRRTASFVLTGIGVAKGSGTCRPSKRACITFELNKGESMLLTMPLADGRVRRLRVTMGSIVALPKGAAVTASKR